MLHCFNTSSCSNMTVLERQKARIKCQQQQQQQNQTYFSGTCATGFNDAFSSSLRQLDNSQGSLMTNMMMMATDDADNDDSSMGFKLPTPPLPTVSGFDGVNSVISRTYSCPPTLVATPVAEANNKDTDLMRKNINSSLGNQSLKKRKTHKPQNTKVVVENDSKDKRVKVGSDDGESKSTGQTSNKNNTTTTTANNRNKETCSDTSKENSKASEAQKPDYIHVRARRGQATDSHSLAERIRREKISERMRYLQDLVPGCNKITGKAGMLDEIINYVQSLQQQVEFLSMKLASVNPRLDFNMDDMFAKEVFPPCPASFPTIGMSSDMTNPSYLQFNSSQQIVSSCGLDTVINTPDMGLRRTISAPVSMPETFLDSSCFTQSLPSSTWEGDFQNLYNMDFDQARATSFPSQLFTGLVEASNLKMEI